MRFLPWIVSICHFFHLNTIPLPTPETEDFAPFSIMMKDDRLEFVNHITLPNFIRYLKSIQNGNTDYPSWTCNDRDPLDNSGYWLYAYERQDEIRIHVSHWIHGSWSVSVLQTKDKVTADWSVTHYRLGGSWDEKGQIEGKTFSELLKDEDFRKFWDEQILARFDQRDYETVKYLAAKHRGDLNKVTPNQKKQWDKWIVALDDDDWQVRDKATNDLLAEGILGALYVDSIMNDRKMTPEQYQRCCQVVGNYTGR